MEVMVLIFYFKNIFQRNENRFINLVLIKDKATKENSAAISFP